ncbi:NADPH-dependent FMN reductase [Actinoplanes sp. RD1]|uniref:NADPH-dependent FMN reductase n=1 Tax=Actinoplanes sp. RD1 TaxID=3064538 RepID=UPI0027414824|nr:NAD(P)H-dependent oxidoreductase [Actinoplanes sp. RD1]
MKTTILVGNPKPQSRTLGTATAVASFLGAADGALVVDLADHATRLFDWSDAELADLTARVAASDLLIVASPTYKATYTGMLKAFLDRYDTDGLHGVVAVPVMTGGGDLHALSIETHLRPLLVELGATVPARGLYMTMAKMADQDAVVAEWGATAGPLIKAAVSARA